MTPEATQQYNFKASVLENKNNWPRDKYFHLFNLIWPYLAKFGQI